RARPDLSEAGGGRSGFTLAWIADRGPTRKRSARDGESQRLCHVAHYSRQPGNQPGVGLWRTGGRSHLSGARFVRIERSGNQRRSRKGHLILTEIENSVLTGRQPCAGRRTGLG